ncbi:MAG: glycosyltransferase family 39 protein [Myxococcaceae bacterium]
MPPQPAPATSSTWSGLWARVKRPELRVWYLMAVMFVLFRVPALLNAGWTNSDGAVTGLQALQIMRGELTWLHWGRPYLTSIDSIMLVPFFAVFGASPWVMMWVTMLGQFTSTAFIFATLKKRLGERPAFVAVLPTVLMTMALNVYLFFHIRTWCVALVACAIWLLDGASESKRWQLRYGLGTAAAILAAFVDLYAIQFIAPLVLFALLCCADGKRDLERWAKRGALVLGSAVAAVGLMKVLDQVAGVSTSRAAWSINSIPHNLHIFWDSCLPALTGAKLFALNDLGPVEQPTGALFGVVQKAGLGIFLLVTAFGTTLWAWPAMPWEKRRFGVLGTALAVVCFIGFIGSGTVVDIWAARMLWPMLFGFVFSVAPLTHFLSGWKLPAVLSPYLLSLLICGWLSYGVFVDGLLPATTARGRADEEIALGKFLREKGVRYATADYWIGYRLTFLFHENPIVVPFDDDRYARYRKEFDAAPSYAYIFHPSEPWRPAAPTEQALQRAGTPYQKLEYQGFIVLLVNRGPPG